jgi:type IV pilus assembly protein PilC
MFTRQLHVMVLTGTPVAEAIAALERQATEPAWRAVLAGVHGKVQEGASLSVALAAFPQAFDAVCCGLVAAGESGGNLDAMLDRLALLVRKQLHARTAIIGAMVYPCLLVVVSIAVLMTLMLFVLPRFTQLFKTLDTPLPPTTKILMTMSSFLQAYWWAIPIVAVGGGVGIHLWLRSAAGQRAVQSALLRLPRIGPITRNFATARLTRLLGILVGGKVPLLEALTLTRDSMTHHKYAALLARAGELVTRGEPLVTAFGDADLIAANVQEAVRSGERTGQLGQLLNTIADFLDEENEVVLRSLTSILEPMILVVLGVLVGFIAISMFMPLFDLTAATGAK